MDPKEICKSVFECLDEIFSGDGCRGEQIAAVGVSSLAATVVGLSTAGETLTPLYLWADKRGADETLELGRAVDAERARQRTGCPFHPSFLPVRLRWLRTRNPELFHRVARWQPIDGYIRERLFGSPADCGLSIASWTGLLDLQAECWDGELLDAVGIGESLLPPLTASAATQTGLRAEYAARWPELGETPWFPALADGAAAVLGAAGRSDYFVANIGTSASLRRLLDRDVKVPSTNLTRFLLDRGATVLGGAVSDAGCLDEWLRSVLRLPGSPELEKVVARRPAACHGLAVLPFWSGERSQGWSRNAQGVVHGLTLNTDAIDMLIAAREAVVYQLTLIYRALATVSGGPRAVVASGGAARSLSWMQALADSLGTEVRISSDLETASRGTALWTLREIGAPVETEEPPRISTVLMPNPERYEMHREALRRQSEIHDRLLGGEW